jgi:hypothetical protein
MSFILLAREEMYQKYKILHDFARICSQHSHLANRAPRHMCTAYHEDQANTKEPQRDWHESP